MKQHFQIFILVALLLGSSVIADADEIKSADNNASDTVYEHTIDGTTYQYTKEDAGNGVTIYEAVTPTPNPALSGKYIDTDGSVYKYSIINNGNAVCLNGHGKLNSSNVVLPAYINDLPVEKVCGDVIPNTGVTSLTIPETCKMIYAFGGCRDLETIVLPEGLERIETYCFNECTALKNINIPSTITKIENQVFNKCSSLEKIVIPDSVVKIEDSAFYHCESLKNVTLGNNILQIGRAAFVKCDLHSIKFPETLVKIEGNAFIDNINLKELTIPSSVTYIGNSAFLRCGLERVNLHSGIQTMESGAFKCESLKEVNGLTKDQIISFWWALLDTPWAKSIQDEDHPFMIDSKGTLIAYVGNESDIVIPDNVKIIGDSAFAGKNMTSVTIPSGVARIETAAFYKCENLTSITIPKTVTNIGQLAFSDCHNLKDITLEYSTAMLTLGSSAFQSTAVTKDTLITNNRKFTNQQNPFANTALDPEYIPAPTDVPKATDAPKVTDAPKATVEPTPNPPEALAVIAKDDSISISVGNKEVVFTDAQPFIDENGRTQIPVRAVSEALDASVEWDGVAKTVTITKGKKKIILMIDSTTMQVDKKLVQMDTAAQIIDGRTYIPVRFVGEALGMQVNWI